MALCAAGPATGAAPAWKSLSVSKHAGTVDAVLSFERRGKLGFYSFRALRLVVKVSGKTVVDRGLCSADYCGPGSHHTLSLQNVWGDGVDEALVSIYTGGAHCCFESIVALLDGGHAGRLLARNWGDPGYRGQSHDGTFDFISADDRFAYEFTSFAGSALPTQVWAISPAGRFVDVTSTRLDLVASDAKQAWQSYVRYRGKDDNDVRGVVAGWCADEYRLGDGQACRTELASARARGYLKGPPEWPQGAKFVSSLERQLAKWGYGAS